MAANFKKSFIGVCTELSMTVSATDGQWLTIQHALTVRVHRRAKEMHHLWMKDF